MSKPIYKLWFTWFTLIVFLWSVSFVAGYAWGSQNCVYTTVIEYDNNGQILNSKQEYKCESPPTYVGVGPQYPNEINVASVEKLEIPSDSNSTSASGDVLGMALLWGLLSSGKKKR